MRHIRVKVRDLGEFLHCPIRVKKHVLQHFVQQTLQEGLNEGVRNPLLAHPMLLCNVKGKDLGEFLLFSKHVKKHVYTVFCPSSPRRLK